MARDMQTDRQISIKFEFSPVNVFDDIQRMGRGSFWYLFDVNRSAFDEDMREKRFSSKVTLTFRPYICLQAGR